MTAGERALFHNNLIEANRALAALGTINIRERSPLTSAALRDCMQVYTQLLRCQASLPLDEEEAKVLGSALDRIRSYLKFHGEDV